MPSKSPAQHRLMAAVAHNPDFAEKVGIPKKVGEHYMEADEGKHFKRGGLYENIHAKQQRIAHGSKEHMRKPGSKGAPTAEAFKEAAKTARLKEGGPSLAVGRGEKLPVDRGAGLTQKGREKYNRETGSHLKAPQPEGGPRKDSFCARMKPIAEKSEPGSRARASMKRWKCSGWQMAYSGTTGQTVINVSKLIDHGARRCGKLAEELTSEQLLSAQESLYFLLSNLGNQGINYWAITKQVVGCIANQYIYYMPVGCIDVLQVLYRQMTQPSGSYSSSAGGTVSNVYDQNTTTYCKQTSANGNIEVNYGTSVYIGSIGIMPYISGGGSQTWNYVFEYSLDNSTWTALYTGTNVTVTDGQWIWQDIDPGQNTPYYRMRATGGTTLSLRELYFGNNSLEIQMSRLNRDDYTNLPNKNFTANQPFQFWFDRTIGTSVATAQPSLYLWPVPSTSFVQMTVWYQRYIDDVGALTNEIEIPQRWYEAIVMNLAHRMSLELPGVQIERIGYLEKMAAQYLFEAQQEERDKSPIYWAPNISVYTR